MNPMGAKVWERQPTDTDKSWAAFQIYLHMPVYGPDGENRTLQNLSEKLGYASPDQVERWSAKFNWQDRVAAFDAAMGNKAIEMREVALEEYQQQVRANMAAQLTLLNQALATATKELLDKQKSNAPVDPIDLQRLAKTAETIDNLMRRIANMPTNYTSERSKEEIDDDSTFIIGTPK